MTDPAPRSDGRLRILVVDADDRVRESLTGLLAIGDQPAGRRQLGARPDPPSPSPPSIAPTSSSSTRACPRWMAGLAFIAGVRASCPEVRILAMSWSATLERPAIDGGAHAFLRKTFRPTELIAAIVAARPARRRLNRGPSFARLADVPHGPAGRPRSRVLQELT